MANKKTSRKQGFSFENMPSVEIRAPLKEHDPKVTLRNTETIVKALIMALEDGDVDAFREILVAHLRVVNKDRFIKQAQISKATFFRILKPNSNPTLDNVARIIHALKKAEPKSRKARAAA